MIKYTLISFLIYLGWSFAGIILHLTGELAMAKRTRKDFKITTFWGRNKYKYLSSLVTVTVICAGIAVSPSQFKELPPTYLMGIAFGWQFYLVGIGYSGGAALKNLLKKKSNA